MYEKAKKNVKKAANQIVENIDDITNPKGRKQAYGRYEKAKKRVKQAANQIADNMEDISKGGKSLPKDYLKDGVAMVDGGNADIGGGITMAKYGVTGGKLGKYIEKESKGIIGGSKKVNV
jgi:hypothetical protein